jgi:hypothetical protein
MDPTGAQQITEYLSLHPEGFVIITDESLARLTPQIPPGIGVVSETGRFLKDDRLILLGRLPVAPQSAIRQPLEHPTPQHR